MRRFIFATLLSLSLATGTGCILPIYSGDRARRTQQLIFNSEDFRAAMNQWERIWFLDQPDHMTPQRVHGGVL